MTLPTGLWLAERGIVPEAMVRWGIRRLLAQRLREQRDDDARMRFLAAMDSAPVAPQPDKANEQHYELPPEFFQLVLGPTLKYSAAWWPNGVAELAAAEQATLQLTCERAELEDGQQILELGCGWGSLSRYMACHYPNSRIVAVSNSPVQRAYIEGNRPPNLAVITADMNDFAPGDVFHRVVSVEMFEHMRNYRRLLERIATWLQPGGKLFVHLFCHRRFAYAFDTSGAGNWMGQHFFTGGIMPSADLLLEFQEHLVLERRWLLDGTHYQRTAAAWRDNLENQRERALQILESAYGSHPERWFHRWRLFFLACEELFGYRAGSEWLVAHYRFAKREPDGSHPWEEGNGGPGSKHPNEGFS